MTERHCALMSEIKSNGLNLSGTQRQCARTDALARCYSVIVLLIAELHSLFNNLLYHFNGWDLKMQLFKFSASRHQQDRGILLETKAKVRGQGRDSENCASRQGSASRHHITAAELLVRYQTSWQYTDV